jgi:hypothetical protein
MDLQKVRRKKSLKKNIFDVLKVTNEKSRIFSGAGSISHRSGSYNPDPDPYMYQNVTDPEDCSVT